MMRLGYLGPKGTFSYEACKKYDKNAEFIQYRTITETIDGLDKLDVDEVIVPIENSIQGGVTETIDKLINSNNIFIKKEIILNISHNLMANKKYNLDEIKEIYSHPQALAQCRGFIEENLRDAIINEVSSTALSAKEVKNKDNVACIANLSCSTEYNLEVIRKNIQDNNLNKTKFWILSKQRNLSGNKMSIIFATKHIPGALYNVLGIFNNNSINLTKIESRPAKTSFGEYYFLVDLEVNANIQKTILELEKECQFLKILGIY